MWYFKERRIPPLLPPHPSSLAAAVHDCLFSIFTVNPQFWGPFGYPQPADALGSCSSLLSASSLAASFPDISQIISCGVLERPIPTSACRSRVSSWPNRTPLSEQGRPSRLPTFTNVVQPVQRTYYETCPGEMGRWH